MGDEKPQADVDPDTSCGSDKKETEGSGKAAGVDRDLQECSGGGGGREVSSGGREVTTVEGGREGGEGGGCELLRRRSMLGSSGQEGAGAGFFAGGWRAQLCKCTTCVVSSARSCKEHTHTPTSPPPPPPPSPSMPPWVSPTFCRRRTVWRPTRGGARPSPPPMMRPWLPCPLCWTGHSRWRSFTVSSVVCGGEPFGQRCPDSLLIHVRTLHMYRIQ